MTIATETLAQPMYFNQIHGAFLDLAKQKLGDLLTQGYRINGFAIAREVEGSDPQRGFITVDGLVGWWTPGLQALERAHEAMEKLRVRCEQAEAVERERDELRAQVEALTKPASRWNWLSDLMQVHWSEGKFTSLVRIVSEEWRDAINASVDRMMTGDLPDAGTPPQNQAIQAAQERWTHDCPAIHVAAVASWSDKCRHCGAERSAPSTPSPLTRPAVPEAQPSDRDAIFKALQETQEALDVSQCPWCGGWGPQYRDNDRPVAYCHHEFTLKPWEMFAVKSETRDLDRRERLGEACAQVFGWQQQPIEAAQPFINCKCHDETARKYCADKNRCSRIEAQAAQKGGV